MTEQNKVQTKSVGSAIQIATNSMKTKITGLTNGYFCVRQNDKKDVMIATLINAYLL